MFHREHTNTVRGTKLRQLILFKTDQVLLQFNFSFALNVIVCICCKVLRELLDYRRTAPLNWPIPDNLVLLNF